MEFENEEYEEIPEESNEIEDFSSLEQKDDSYEEFKVDNTEDYFEPEPVYENNDEVYNESIDYNEEKTNLDESENFSGLEPIEESDGTVIAEGYSEDSHNSGVELLVDKNEQKIDAMASRIETSGKIIENTGRGVEATGTTLQATGKSMQATGKTVEVVGKGTEAAGVAIGQGGQSITEAGAGLTETGVGAILGVPMVAAGALLTGAGKGTEIVGKGAQSAGKAVDKAGKSVDTAGKNIRQKGKQIKHKGKELKKTSNDIRNMQNQKRNRKLNGIIPKVNTKNGMPRIQSKEELKASLAKIKNAKGTLKIPLKTTLILIGIIAGLPLIFLMLFVAVFNEEGKGGGSSAGNFMYGQTCTTVSVNNTGCDVDADNCSHVYDGDVSFEEYIAGVVAAEVGSANNLEYYKLTAIAARTYFINNTSGTCSVNGNATFQAYMDVEDSSNAELIKQAVEETENLVLIKNDKLASTYYASACVVNADDDYYYVRYGTKSLGEANFQKIPKEWDQNESIYKNYLSNWYALTDQTNTDYENKPCPKNHDYGMSQLGALYLITGENYTYEEVIDFYYGEDAEIIKNEMQFTGVEGFVNPTRYINCSSPFGYRTHPVNGGTELHTGLDIAIPGGEPIYAASDGVVRKVVDYVSGINNCNYGYGNYIIIDHADGLSTLYAHMKYGSISDSIQVGATVSQGEQIGQVGSTGCSTGNHLHYEVRLNNLHIDPADYIDLTGATGACRR